MVLRLEIYEEPIRGTGPIRMVDSPSVRMLSKGDYVRFVGPFSKAKEGFWEVTYDLKFSFRKVTVTYAGSKYNLILGPGQKYDIDLTDMHPDREGVLVQTRIGIPEDILLYIRYPTARMRFRFDKPGISVNPDSNYEDRYIGAFDSSMSPFYEPKLELTLFYGNENAGLTVKNETSDYVKPVLNMKVNMMKIRFIGKENEVPDEVKKKAFVVYHPDLMEW